MFNQVLEVVMRVIQFCLDFVFSIFDGLGATGFIFGAFATAVVFRLLLLPVLGGRADFSRREMNTPRSKGNTYATLQDDAYFDYLTKG